MLGRSLWLSPKVKREEDLSLFDLVKGRGLAKQDPSPLDLVERRRVLESSRIGFSAPFRLWRLGAGGRLFPKREEVFSLLNRLCRNRRCRLLTWGEETEGVDFSPGVKKPTV